MPFVPYMPSPRITISRETVVMLSFNASNRLGLQFPDKAIHRQNNVKQNNASIKPTLVLHMGPPKTSSSYLQCILTSMTDTLALDSYNYLDLEIEQCKNTQSHVPVEQQPQRHCYDIFTGKYTAQLDHTFLQGLDETLQQGRNAIIVNECFM
jgi:hypothetical protein